MSVKTSFVGAATSIVAGLAVLMPVSAFAGSSSPQSSPIMLAQASGSAGGEATAGDAEAQRIAEEEESFMKLLAEQRREEAEAKAAAEAAKKAAAEKAEAERVAREEESFMKLLAEQRREEAEAKKAAEAKAAAEAAARKAAAERAEQERIAREEQEFLNFLAEQRRQEAEAKAAAEAAKKAAVEKAEAERIAKEEDEFLKFLAEQRRQEAEAKKAAAEAEMSAEAERKAAAALCEKRLAEIGASGTIQFASNSADIAEASKAVLDKLVDAAFACERELTIQVDGHTDATGSDALNMRLSQERAQSVADYLAEKGIARKRLTARGYGETKPIADNRTRAGRAKNRRIEFKVN